MTSTVTTEVEGVIASLSLAAPRHYVDEGQGTALSPIQRLIQLVHHRLARGVSGKQDSIVSAGTSDDSIPARTARARRAVGTGNAHTG
jgi:hypothetical protein